jgi:hypothetical protein
MAKCRLSDTRDGLAGDKTHGPADRIALVKIFALYVEDDRYSVPTLVTAELPDDAAAMAHAMALLNASPHYRAVEVWDDDRRVGMTPRRDDLDGR